MKRLLIISFICVSIILSLKVQAMQNPWVDCGDDFECATRVSGISFPLRLSNYWIRSMKDMIEIRYPLDEFRNVEVRKKIRDCGYDISGVYTRYPLNRKMKLKNGIVVNTRGTFRKIYVVNMNTLKAYYSAYCKQGMSKKEARGVCEVILEAESF